jgi:ribose 5-phosphate isomerase B
MTGGSYRLTPRAPPARSVDSAFMRVAFGSDHAGFSLKENLKAELVLRGHDVVDLGTSGAELSVDYPDFGAAVGRAVAAGEADLGVCTCGSGNGIAMAANKISGIRAAVVHDVTTASLARRHNHANVVCLGSRMVGATVAVDALLAFLSAEEEGGRHRDRIAKLARLDRELVHNSEGTQ